MASRAQKRAKRMRARAHQAEARTSRPYTSPSFHKSDPPRYGDSLKRRLQLQSFCDRLGFTPTREQIDFMITLVEKGEATSSEVADKLVAERWRQIHGQHTVVEVPPLVADDIISPNGYVKVDGLATAEMHESAASVTDEQIANATYHPEPGEWDELVATAKRRKRGIARFAEAQGFRLVDETMPKSRHTERESWIKA